MTTIQEKQRRLLELLDKERESYDITQRIQFDWLENIKAQLDLFDDDPLEDEEPYVPEPAVHHVKIDSPRQSTPVKESDVPRVQVDIPTPDFSDDEIDVRTPEKPVQEIQSKPKLTTIAQSTRTEVASPMAMPMSAPLGRCCTAPVLALQDTDRDEFASGNSTVRFVDGDCLLDTSSDSDDCTSGVPLTSTGSMKELTMSAASFRMKWKEMLDVKKACTNQPVKQPVIFAFEQEDFYQPKYRVKEEEADPDVYEMTDDEDDYYQQDDPDDEMYETNPHWVHGKKIPSWARGRKLSKQMKLQKSMTKSDIDEIFSGFTADCPLPEIFKTRKARYDHRNDSGWWDADSVPQEETDKMRNLLRMGM